MNEALILQRLYNLERETGLVDFHYSEVLKDDPASGFQLAVLVDTGYVLINDADKTISLSIVGREMAIDLFADGVDPEAMWNEMLQEAAHIDLTGVWAEV